MLPLLVCFLYTDFETIQHLKFFVNVPYFMTWIYWLVKPVMPARTFAKLRVAGVSPPTIGKELLPHIEASELPRAYGGEAVGFSGQS